LSGYDYAKSLLPFPPSVPAVHEVQELGVTDGAAVILSAGPIGVTGSLSEKGEINPPQALTEEEEEEELRAKGRMWGKCPCCIGCVSSTIQGLPVCL
jgi:hypothetical protein